MNLIECPPDLGNFTKSLLNIGYSHYIAVLDIIDNSIAAGASKVWIKYEDNDIIISDNGHGMTREELFQAMRVASSDPSEIRSKDSDLGKFGLGLKLASFSLSDCFQVISKCQNSDLSSFQWNLDIVREKNSWMIEELMPKQFHRNLKRQNGTDVIIKNLRVKVDDQDVIIDRLRTHIAVVYSRIASKVEFTVEDKLIKMIDPFFSENEAGNYSSPDLLTHKNVNITTQSFQIPHKDKLNVSDKKTYDKLLEIGMSDGIYLFRKNRLIAWSGWEGLGVNKRIGDLQRLAISIDANADELFNIEVKKSQISILDDGLRSKIRSKIKIFFNTAKRPYKRRAELSLSDISDIWKIESDGGLIVFTINNESKIVKKFLNNELSKVDFIKLVGSMLPMESLLYYLNNDKYNTDKDVVFKKEAFVIMMENGLITKAEFDKLVNRYG